jgi:hypothetical protein
MEPFWLFDYPFHQNRRPKNWYLLLGIDPKGGEALSSHHIWMFILYIRTYVCTYVYTYVRTAPPPRCCPTDRQAGGLNEHPYVMR